MKYAALEQDAGLALQYDQLAFAALSQVSNRFLPWTNASLRPAAIQVALNDIVVNRRRTVVELGSGLSTVYLAAMLAGQGGRLISVDHDASWIEIVRQWLPPRDAAVVQFIHAPLRSARFDTEAVEWYDRAAVADALQELPPIDLVVVDGPPAYRYERCLNRGPALDMLAPHLASSATVLLDDLNRSGEQHIARCWSEKLGANHRDLTVEAGIALWTLGTGNNISQ